MTKYLGYSILAAAVSASLAVAQDGAQTGGMKVDVSYTPGKGLTLDAGEKFKATLLNYIQANWTFAANDTAPDTNNFDVSRARSALRGHAFNKNIHWFLQLDYTDDSVAGVTDGPVRDAWAQWNFVANGESTVGIRVGQAKSYHGLESTGFANGFFFVDRSASSQAFSTARSQGAWIHSSYMENKLKLNVGAQNGDVAAAASGINEGGDQGSNADNELTFVANASYDLFGDFFGGDMKEFWQQGNFGQFTDTRATIGAGVMVGNNQNSATNDDVEATQININTAWAFGSGLGVQGEVFLRSDDPETGTDEDTTGFYAQGMYVLAKNGDSNLQWGFGVRFDQIKTDDTVNFLSPSGLAVAGDVREVSLVGNAFYHGHNCKTQFQYTWQDVNPDAGNSDTNHIISIAFQLVF